jgi:anaerobic dimethyl sulfoxide reductase subunit B (iron-sulfur subunit)
MNRAVFIVDMASCTGCYACSIACKDRAGLPDELDLLRVEENESGAYPEPNLHFRVVHCFHCAEPPCAEVCPTQAILRQENDLVTIDAEECIGCGECIKACPFHAVVMLPDGVAAKCNGCADEVARGWQPTCVRACPMRALGYKSSEDLLFESRLQDPDFQDHGIEPAVLYLLSGR